MLYISSCFLIIYYIYNFVLSCSVISDSLWPMECSSPGSSVYGDSPGKNTGVGHHFFLQGIFPTQGLNPGLPDCRQIDSLPAESPVKPKNTGVGCLSLLQGILPIQELNQNLPHPLCPFSRWPDGQELSFLMDETQIWGRNGPPAWAPSCQDLCISAARAADTCLRATEWRPLIVAEELPQCTRETWVQSLGQEDPLEEEMATHSSILAWRIPIDRGALWATFCGVAKSQTQLSD